ncbi:NAD(P)/FAD-dependent oxidoreductase [Streptomyces parvus]|uniref:NAD(P)/FAD-dependent oxidoreductase n=1 Tax=Streptomyces parvus TaxID=66428 RepID=UPI00331BD45F
MSTKFGESNPRDTDTPEADGMRDAVVVGGGFTGLTAALELAERGHRVTIVEREAELGGLAGSFDVGNGRRIERFYHHWFGSDREMFDLCERLGVPDALEPHRTRTGMYYANSVYRLSRPLDLLRFAPLPLLDRLRLGILALRGRRVTDWRTLEHRTAEEWLISLGGRRVYDVVWRPLLEGKFGQYAGQVGATWMWTKLALRGGSRNNSGSEVLYYLRGGCETLVDALHKRLAELGVEVLTSTSAAEVTTDGSGITGVRTEDGTFLATRQVLLTVAPEIAANLISADGPAAPAHPEVPALERRLRDIRYLANVCLVLENNRRLSDTYWLNVNDPSFPYVGVIEHTNMDSPSRYGNRHVVYLSKYLPADAELYRMSDEEVFDYSLPHLRRMFPGFDRSWVDDYHVWRAEYSQPVITPNYSRAIPPTQTGVRGLYLASMAQVFPEDRGTNHAVREGRRTAELMADRLRTAGRAAAPRAEETSRA